MPFVMQRTSVSVRPSRCLPARTSPRRRRFAWQWGSARRLLPRGREEALDAAAAADGVALNLLEPIAVGPPSAQARRRTSGHGCEAQIANSDEAG